MTNLINLEERRRLKQGLKETPLSSDKELVERIERIKGSINRINMLIEEFRNITIPEYKDLGKE